VAKQEFHLSLQHRLTFSLQLDGRHLTFDAAVE
jgi:hypothetical protein